MKIFGKTIPFKKRPFAKIKICIKILNLFNYNPSNMTKFQNIIFLTRLKLIIPLKYRIIQNIFCLHFIVLPYLPLSVANSIKVNNTFLFLIPLT